MPGKHRLYMHCPGLSEDQLHMYFQQFGRVTDVYLPKGLDGQSKGYGFASFETADALSAALGAGEEHAIRGKTVRVNGAGPRPAVHLTSSGLDPGRPQPAQASSIPISGGVSRQRGGHSLTEPGSSNNLLPNPGPIPGTETASSGAAPDNLSALRSSIPQGAGPRIYVGGIPNAVSETMVRKCFSNWGKVEDVYFPKERSSGRRRPFCFVTFASQKAAEKAVAQSNRAISGHQVASISMTADRIAHYQQVSGGGEEIQRMFQDIEPAHPFALSLQGLFPQLAAAQVQQASLSALSADSIMLGHQQGLPTLGVDSALGSLMGLGGNMNYSLGDSALPPSAFASQPLLGQQHLSQQPLGQQQLAQQQLAQQQLVQSGPQVNQQQLGHKVTGPGSANPHALQFVGSGVVQPHLQEARFAMAPDMTQAGDMGNSGVFPSSVHGLGSPYGQLSHQHVLQQQAMSHQHAHRAIIGQHGQSTQHAQPLGSMLSYNSCPLDSNSVFRAQLGATPHALAQTMGQESSAGQAPRSDSQTPSLSQDFNPTVGSRRPNENSNNFGEALSAFQDPLMGPYLFSQIPDTHKAGLHGHMRHLVFPRSVCPWLY